MKVYRRMDIGTAKPPLEARQKIKYHLIDVVEPSESFSVGMFLEQTLAAIDDIKSRGKPVIAVGGTALYIKALLQGLFNGPGSDETIRQNLKLRAQAEGLEKLHQELSRIDPEAASRIHQNDAKRIIRALEVFQLTGTPISAFQTQWYQQQSLDVPASNTHDAIRTTNDAQRPMPLPLPASPVHRVPCTVHRAPDSRNWTIIGLRSEKEIESKRINARVKKMIDQGLVDEVKSLLAEDKPLSKQAACAIGYTEIIDYLNGKTSLDDAIELVKKNSRYLAKHQRTWFRSFRNVNWLDLAPDESPDQILQRAMEIIKTETPS